MIVGEFMLPVFSFPMVLPMLVVCGDAIPKYSVLLGVSILSIMIAVSVAFLLFLSRIAISAPMCFWTFGAVLVILLFR